MSGSKFPLLPCAKSSVSLPRSISGKKNIRETGKKNKREDRGSFKEETNTAKRSNKELNGQEEEGDDMGDND